LKIELKGRSFQTALFDKRDSFPFSIVRMPYKSSNIPSKTFYATIGAEILRIGRASSTPESFSCAGKQIVQRMLRQGADANKLSKVLKRTYGRHEDLYFRFSEALDFSYFACKAFTQVDFGVFGCEGVVLYCF